MSPPDADPLKVERATTLRALALDRMREAIWSGHLRPGERLVERTLCERLDVSRSIVREVLRHLETEGLVETGARQGPVVATLTVDQAMQIYEIRGLLEGRAAAACATRATDATLERLEAARDAIREAFALGDTRAVLERTTAFYAAMFDEAGLSVAWEVVRALNGRINRLRAMTIATPGRAADAGDEMARIVDAVRARDPRAASAASEAHVRRVAELARVRLERGEA